MYPFTTDTGIVRNRWYMAAFSDEISREPMERTLLGKPVALYRKENGDPVAIYGLCPHRYFPLAKGRLKGDAIVCGYHGFVFAADGKCIEVPSQGTGTGFCQPTYPIIERGPLCWIWMGDADKCDLALIPPHEDFELDQPGWRYHAPNYVHVKGRAQLLIDNLMDLTHLPYIHSQIGGGESMSAPKMRETDRERSYQVVRSGKLPWSHFNDLVWGAENAFEGFADFDQLSDFYGPEFIRTGFPIMTRVPGHETVPPELGTLHILHAVTPETEHSCHYFGFSTRNFRLESGELDDFQYQSDVHVRQQDAAAIAAVEERLEQAAAVQRELLVKSDGPAVKVRKMIQAMLDAERSNEKADSSH